MVLELCQKEQLVIATGGGAPCYDDMMDLMNAAGTTVYIQMSPPALRDRLLHSRTERPLIKGKSAEELLDYISSMLSSREPYYQKAHVKVDGCHLDAAALQQAIALH